MGHPKGRCRLVTPNQGPCPLYTRLESLGSSVCSGPTQAGHLRHLLSLSRVAGKIGTEGGLAPGSGPVFVKEMLLQVLEF